MSYFIENVTNDLSHATFSLYGKKYNYLDWILIC